MEFFGVASQLTTPKVRQRFLERANAGVKGTNVFSAVTSITLEMQHMCVFRSA
ncbi:UDP-glucose 4-epimerase (plasmid) [Ralstonia solanacearum]|nr:UDP-glucose 4-epimerase [Ralstonia solanacearum]